MENDTLLRSIIMDHATEQATYYYDCIHHSLRSIIDRMIHYGYTINLTKMSIEKCADPMTGHNIQVVKVIDSITLNDTICAEITVTCDLDTHDFAVAISYHPHGCDDLCIALVSLEYDGMLICDNNTAILNPDSVVLKHIKMEQDMTEDDIALFCECINEHVGHECMTTKDAEVFIKMLCEGFREFT